MTVKLSAIAEIAVNHCTVEDKCTVSSIEQEEQERKKKKKTMQETEREREREKRRKGCESANKTSPGRLVDRGSESEIACRATGKVYGLRYPLCALIKQENASPAYLRRNK